MKIPLLFFLQYFEQIGARLPLKMHFLKSHLDFFPENLGEASDQQGERFHQDLKAMEDRFGPNFNPEMLGEYCWQLLRDTPNIHKRASKRKYFQR